MGKTKIAYTDYTWNPVTGCDPVGEGCRNCWAQGLHEMRHKAHQNGKKMPAQYAWPFTTIQLHEERLMEPLKIRKPSKIAVCLGGDLYHKDVPDSFIEQVYAVMALCPQHVFQVLTKRPERRRKWYAGLDGEDGEGWRGSVVEGCAQNLFAKLHPEQAKNVDEWLAVNLPLPNVWEGVSVWDQPPADAFIPILLQTPVAVRWVSYEPAIGAVDLRYLHHDGTVEIDSLSGTHGVLRPHQGKNERLDWTVVGGESGPHARPCNVEWIRSIVEQCKDAEVPVFVKQMGDYSTRVDPTDDVRGPVTKRILWQKRAGADPAEWPADLQVRQFPIP